MKQAICAEILTSRMCVVVPKIQDALIPQM